ncbi:MAG: CDP-alcohol phosphatidyltransferase family protein [Jatrophihabitans sp.]
MIRIRLVGPTAARPDRLMEQLDRLPVRDSVVVVGSATGTATDQLRAVLADLEVCIEAGAALGVLDDAVTVPDEAILMILDDPGLTVAALIALPAGAHPVVTNGSIALSAGTASHPVAQADGDSLGVLVVAAGATPSAAAAVGMALEETTPAWDGDDPHDLLLTVLTRASALPAPVAVPLGALPGGRSADPLHRAALDTAIEAADVPDLVARSAARPGDGFYSTYVLRRISARLTPSAVRRGVSANGVTIGSALVGLLGAVLFAVGGRPALAGGAILLQLSLVLDCVDGEIARATRTRSAIGGWLDAATDRVKEYAALAGLAFAAGHLGHHVWLLAAAGMVVQTARHLADFALAKEFLAAHRACARDSRPMSDHSLWQPSTGAGADADEAPSLSMWVRRTLHMPIGERWLALSVCALLGAPTAGLVAYLALSTVSLIWTVLGGIRRTAAAADGFTGPVLERLVDFRDDGLLRLAIGRRCPRSVAGWLLPAAVTLLEGGVVIGCVAAVAPTWAGAGFALLATLIWHRYDLVYRRAASGRVPGPVDLLGLGWFIRTIAIGLGTVLSVLPPLLVMCASWLFVVYLPESLRAARSLLHRQPG